MDEGDMDEGDIDNHPSGWSEPMLHTQAFAYDRISFLSRIQREQPGHFRCGSRSVCEIGRKLRYASIGTTDATERWEGREGTEGREGREDDDMKRCRVLSFKKIKFQV